ncbi:MAG: DUF1489 domain-containing protein [Proteobacteria bacterium]|nr:DUF1489 domain-containing protein [Pseudomonadota bacterium]
MSQHLIKLSVGVEDVRHLARLQDQRLADAERRGGVAELKHVTRNTPKRAKEILKGGSIFWVIKGFVRARQPVIALRPVERDDGRPACALVLKPGLIRTELRSFRPFQGWRYLSADDAPPDAAFLKEGQEDVPDEMAAELKGLGLL